MGRFVERMRAVGSRRAALIVVITAVVVAVGLYLGVRETGVSERTEAGAVVAQARAVAAAEQSDEEEMSGQGSGRASDGEEAGLEPLTLTLSAPQICEAHRPEIGGGYDGERWWSWASVGTMEVSWAVAGGDGAYTVTIVGETYTGASGSAEVSCAMEHGPVSTLPDGRRIHAADDMPLVDSGPKTVSATVVDGSGATATASVDVYAVLNRGLGSATKRDRDGSVLRDQDGSVVYDDTLEGGKTYRIDGILMTVPSEVDLVVGESMDYSPGSDDVDDRCCSVWIIWIAGSDAALVLWGTYEEANRVVPAGGAANAIDANRAFDEFLASFGQPPKLEGGAEPLTLTLSAPTTCDVKRASREVTAIVTGKNEDTGEAQYKFGDWTDVQTVLVRWQASGGAPPYTLVIDGESRDANEEYVGEAGGAFVSCALENGETYFSDRWGPMQRWHRTTPTVDSGLKTIHATVTDSAGATGSASIDVYAVRKVASDGVTLEPGKTYRLHGHLVTVPLNISVEVAYTEDSDCDGPNCEGTVKALAAVRG